MAYRLSQDNSMLYDGNTPLLKAANDVGKLVLQEMNKGGNFSSVSYGVLPLTYVKEQKTWLDTKGRYLLFDISESTAGIEAVAKYQSQFNSETEPTNVAEIVDFSGGALATDGGAVLGDRSGGVIDVPKDSDNQVRKLKESTQS